MKTNNTLRKVAIVGLGNVGATFAYALTLSGLASEIVLVDINEKKAQGEAMDLNHAIPLVQPARIWAGGYEDIAGAAITVVTAGSAQRPGESRLDLLARNVAIFKSLIPAIVNANPDGLILIATNPVDILSYAAWRISGLAHERVIGSGTVLDTARFRFLLSEAYDVDARSVHAFIIGEHGDSELAVWSLANIAGMRLNEFAHANARDMVVLDYEKLEQQTRDAAYEIIEAKGATYYAIGVGLLRIVESILRDQGTVLSVSTYIEDFKGVKDVYMSLPCIIGQQGIEQVMHLPLSEQETEKFQVSGALMSSFIEKLDLP
jgi:L-lactate dehydrogenase